MKGPGTNDRPAGPSDKPGPRDFAGMPASEYDRSHIPVPVRAQLGRLNPEVRGKLLRAANADPTGDGIRSFGAAARGLNKTPY